jgi:hypothetical protein
MTTRWAKTAVWFTTMVASAYLSEAILSGATFIDPDPELNELEENGKTVFTRACAQCHGGALHPGTSASDVTLAGIRPLARYHPILTACPRPANGRLRTVPVTTQPKRAHVPNYACERHHADLHDLGPWTIASHRRPR